MSTVTAIYDDTYDLGFAIATAKNEFSGMLVQESVVLQDATTSGFVEIEVAGATNQLNQNLGELTVRTLFSDSGGAQDKLVQGYTFPVKTPGYGPFTVRSDLLILPGGGTCHVTFKPIYSPGIVVPAEYQIRVANGVIGTQTVVMRPKHDGLLWESPDDDEIALFFVTAVEAAAASAVYTEGAGWYLVTSPSIPFASRAAAVAAFSDLSRAFGFGAVDLQGRMTPHGPRGNPWVATWSDFGTDGEVEAYITLGYWRPAAEVDLTIRVIEL
jgi:hypothetical protein